MEQPKISREVAQRVLEVVDQGLCRGLGEPQPGQMCVEAAVCFAMGLPHSDEPHCVGSAVRSFKIRLNDANWPSNEARAKGMRRVAIAQLGSDQIDQQAFAQEVTLQVTRQLLPVALRAAASAIPSHRESLESVATLCEAVTEFSGVLAVAQKARAAAYAAAAYAAAADAAYAAAAAAAYAAYAAAADAAYAAADAAADAAYAAAAAADAAKKEARESVLRRAAEIGVQALIKLGAQGAEWLDLCGEES